MGVPDGWSPPPLAGGTESGLQAGSFAPWCGVRVGLDHGVVTEILRYAAFTDDPRGGNPAGVVLDAIGVDDVDRQRIAADVGYSETAFLEPGEDRRHGLRFFSPVAEVAFCGHATIATAVALAERDGPGDLTFSTPAGRIEVATTVEADRTVARLTSVPTTSRPATGDELAEALAALRWSEAALAPDTEPHVAFAGNQHLVLEVRSREVLASLDYAFDALADVMTRHGWTTVQVVWTADDGTVHSRNPFPVGGVVEDPATGAAAAALGGYLRAVGRASTARTIVVVQGEDMGRRSVLRVDVDPHDPRVAVSGTAVRI